MLLADGAGLSQAESPLVSRCALPLFRSIRPANSVVDVGSDHPRDAPERSGGKQFLQVIAAAGRMPVERREFEDAMQRPTRQQAQDVPHVAPGLEAEHATARKQHFWS
jgi:hypothetical protein